jgi:hypothetical protein
MGGDEPTKKTKKVEYDLVSGWAQWCFTVIFEILIDIIPCL